MSRPTIAEAAELEALECAALKLARAQELAGIVAIRMRQVLRRAPGLRELVTAGQAQLTAVADAMDEAHSLVCEVLDAKGVQRRAKHYGGGDGDAGSAGDLRRTDGSRGDGGAVG